MGPKTGLFVQVCNPVNVQFFFWSKSHVLNDASVKYSSHTFGVTVLNINNQFKQWGNEVPPLYISLKIHNRYRLRNLSVEVKFDMSVICPNQHASLFISWSTVHLLYSDLSDSSCITENASGNQLSWVSLQHTFCCKADKSNRLEFWLFFGQFSGLIISQTQCNTAKQLCYLNGG